MKLKIPFGERDGRLFFVGEVENGLKCGCTCTSCGRPLEARNNPKNVRVAYFAHSKLTDCAYHPMTDVHRMAQQILFDAGSIITPEFKETPELCLDDNIKFAGDPVVLKGNRIIAEEASIEESWFGFRIDVVYRVNGRPLFIEVAVTHFVDESKRQRIVSENVACIELNLSKVSDEQLFSRAKFSELVLSARDHGIWIHNPKGAYLLDQAKKILLEDNVEEIKKLRNEKYVKETRKRQEAKIKADFEEARSKARQIKAKSIALLRETSNSDWLERRERVQSITRTNYKIDSSYTKKYEAVRLVGVPLHQDWVVNVDRITWQQYILDEILESEAKYSRYISTREVTNRILTTFGALGFMNQFTDELEQFHSAGGMTERSSAIQKGCWYLSNRERGLIVSPRTVILSYLNELAQTGCVAINRDQVVMHRKSPRIYVDELAWTKERQQKLLVANELSRGEEVLDWKRKLDRRIKWLRLADIRLLDVKGGHGFRCENCECALLAIEHQCPFCTSNRRAMYSVTSSDINEGFDRYTCSIRPRNSVLLVPEIDTTILVNYEAHIDRTW